MRLVTQGFEGQPASELLPYTADEWAKAAWRGSRYVDPAVDVPRLEDAGTILIRNSDRWPTCKAFCDAIPGRDLPLMLAKDRPEPTAEGLEQIGIIAAKLGIGPDGPAPAPEWVAAVEFGREGE